MGVITNLFLTLLVVVLAIPGLVIEPGPFSEIIAATFIASIWGIDFSPTDGGENS